jgi:UDP-N-acetyl-D-glucosamine dehydrogenase
VDNFMLLREKIAARSLHIAVIGLGYVGLTLATALAEAGFRVIGIDVDQQKVDMANKGESYIPTISSSSLRTLIDTKHLQFTGDYASLDNIDVISICVPTPLRKRHIPDLSYIISSTQQVQARLHSGQLIILESTTYPGTTDEIVLAALELTGLKVGVDFFLAYSPERIDQGNLNYSISNTPKIVGGVTAACTALAQTFYETIIEKVMPVSSTYVAEMSKLLENTFRAVNIGLVNEIAIMCEKLHINVWEVVDAAATKPFGFMSFFPGPGPGGDCIPVDPYYLSWKLKTLDYTPRFIELATKINSGMRYFVVQKISEALQMQGRNFEGATVLVLGVAYKRNVGDTRESPALGIMKILMKRKARVLYNDEYVPNLTLGGQKHRSQSLSSDLLRTANCVVIVTDHSYIDVTWIIEEARSIVDTRNMTRGHNDKKIFRL